MANPLNRFAHLLREEVREACGRPVLATVLLLAFVSLAFLALPDLDRSVSRLFYDPATGFLDRRYSIVQSAREAGQLVEWALALAVCVPLLMKFLLPDSHLMVRPRATLFVLASYLIGPGLIVNGILKDHWGRARPRQILDFGGDATFSSVWWLSDQCQRNCSFASGEGASAFWLMAIVFLVPREWKWPVGVATFAFATIVSLTRIAEGGHFLSDVLVAWLLTLLVLLLSRRLFLEALPSGFDSAVEAMLGRGGRALRSKLGTWLN